MTHFTASENLPPCGDKPTLIVAQPPQDANLEKGVVRRVASSGHNAHLRKETWVGRICNAPLAAYNWFHRHANLDPRIEVRNIDKCPSGYPKLAAFVDSDPNFTIYRRFGYLRTRLLLYQQDMLRSTETELDDLDSRDGSHQDTERLLCSRERDDSQQRSMRKELFSRLGDDIKAYDELLLRTSTLNRLDEPRARNRRSVAGLIWHDGQLARPDRDYLNHVDDLLTLGGDKEHTWVHAIFARTFMATNRQLTRFLFQSHVQKAKTEDSALGIELYSKPRLDLFVAFVFTAVITGFLMGPVFILYRLQENSGIELTAIMLGFTFGFAILCQLCTSAKRHEIFASTAAYCAVLVVFISQGSGSSFGSPAK